MCLLQTEPFSKNSKLPGVKKPVLLFWEKIDHCDLMKYTFNWPKLSSLGKSEISRGQCTKNIIFLYFSNLGV